MPSITVLLAALAVTLPDSTPRPTAAPATVAELMARIQRVLDTTRTPGVGLVIVRHDSVIFAGGIGKARVSPATPATDSTLFRIGSTSKAFVALTALAMEREGKLSLNDPLLKHLPEFYFRNPWERTDPVRLVHLLEHTSGFDDNSIKAYASSDPTPLRLAQGLALDSATRVSRWRPGTRFAYCNTGPAIVARIIELLEGKPFEQVVQERWFDPIGMRTATYLLPDTTRVAMATLYRADGTTPVPYWHVFVRPAGSINASALDMGAYLRFLLGRGMVDSVSLLAPEALARAERSETWIGRRAGLPLGYGLHLYTQADTLGFVWTGHNGGVEGGLSDLSYLVDAGVGYAFQINAGNGTAFGEIANLVRGFLRQELTAPRPPPIARVPSAVAREFGGWYRPVSPRTQVAYFGERLIGLTHVTFSDSLALTRPMFGEVTAHPAVDSMRFRRHGQSVATLAFSRDSLNGRTRAFDDEDGTSFARISTGEAWISIALLVGWVVAVIVPLVAICFGMVRWLVRKARRRNTPTAPTAAQWRIAAGASAMMVLHAAALAAASSNLAAFGTVSRISVLLVGSAILFAVFAVYGLSDVLKPRDVTTRWTRWSLGLARAVLTLHAIAAAYLLMFGYIGWRPWV
jgi:CubicO group peptidase (beta-lactamase class C family)